MSETPARVVNGLTFDGFDTEREPGCIIYKGPFGNRYAINADCQSFGFRHGQTVVARKGPMEGSPAIVLGVYQEALWVHYIKENVAAAVKGAADAQQLAAVADLQLVRSSPVGMITGSGPLGIDYVFDQNRLVEKFGLRADEKVSVNGKNVTAIGELFGVLWIRPSSGTVVPLPGATNEASLHSLYAVGDPVDPSSGALTPRRTGTPRSTQKPYTVDIQKQTATCEAAFGNRFDADISRKALQPFGVAHGQQLSATEGALKGKTLTIVGVHLGSLWVLVEGDRRVSCLRNCPDGATLREKCGFGSGVKSAKSPETPAEPTTPSKPRPATVSSPRAASKEAASPTHKRKEFTMWTSFGRQVFDIALPATAPFGFAHGQTIKASRGADKGSVFHVVGVAQGCLWVVQENKPRAVPLRHCTTKEDIQSRFGFAVVGKKELEYLSAMESEPALTPVATPRGSTVGSPREYSAASSPRDFAATSPRGATTSYAAAPSGSSPVPSLNFSALSPSPPAQSSSAINNTTSQGFSSQAPKAGGGSHRNFLKAVALLKTGAQNAGDDPLRFHKYYMSNTTQRLNHAMSRFNVFKEQFGEDFDRATTDDMLQLMRRRAELFS